MGEFELFEIDSGCFDLVDLAYEVEDDSGCFDIVDLAYEVEDDSWADDLHMVDLARETTSLF